MKLIEAMKQLKMNEEKMGDIIGKIGTNCANLNYETLPYGNETSKKVKGWLQLVNDLTQENCNLLIAIQKTNLNTEVTIKLGEKEVTKSIAEWIWRRRKYAAIDAQAWQALTDRNLREGQMTQSTGEQIDVKITRQFDPNLRDKMIEMYNSEPQKIDSRLEVVNAITDLME